MNPVNQIFTEAFDKCSDFLPYNKEWSNQVGHLDNAVYGEHAPKIEYGRMVRSCSPGGRRILIIGTRLGNLVVFDRFTNQDKDEKDQGKAIFIKNCTSALIEGGWFSDISMTTFDMELAVGTEDMVNLGRRMEMLYSSFKKLTT